MSALRRLDFFLAAWLNFSVSIIRELINNKVMSDQTSFISQIKEEEAKATKTLEIVEVENDARLLKAGEEADGMVEQAEEDERAKAKELIMKAKEEGKATYSKLLVDADNARRDVVQNGKANVSKGKTHVVQAFMSMFE